jgi:hypothetical protein
MPALQSPSTRGLPQQERVLGHRVRHQVLRLLVQRPPLPVLRSLSASGFMMEPWLLFAALVVPAAAFAKLASP